MPDETPAPDMAAGHSAKKEKKEFTSAERLLLLAALIIGVLYDRLSFAPFIEDADHVITRFSGIFWMCCLAVFYLFYWKKVAHNRVLWFIAGCCTALCAWSFLFTGSAAEYRNSEFDYLTYLVIPAVLMAHTQLAAGDYRLKDAGKIALAWLTGWIIKPFSGLPAFFGATGSLFSGGNKSTAKRAALGALIALPILCVIIPLLSGADKVFGYYLKQIAGNWDFSMLVVHTLTIAIAVMLFYSFLWNVGFGAKEKAAEKTAAQIDAVVSCIVLGSVTLVYVLFCAVQFTYLFAGAGLPDGMTYSEYAREGFAQTVAVCAINLLIFGIFLQFGKKSKVLAGLLAGLLALTGVMLISGFVRLKLYIDAYGLTWLRVLSAWFVIYLMVVVIVCCVRMFREKLPAVALCALILLGWYVVLGYSNPDALITQYNQTHFAGVERILYP